MDRFDKLFQSFGFYLCVDGAWLCGCGWAALTSNFTRQLQYNHSILCQLERAERGKQLAKRSAFAFFVIGES